MIGGLQKDRGKLSFRRYGKFAVVAFERHADDLAVEKAANALLQPKGMRATLSRQGDDCVLTCQYGAIRSVLRRSYPFSDSASIVEAMHEWVANRMGGLHRYVDMDEAS